MDGPGPRNLSLRFRLELRLVLEPRHGQEFGMGLELVFLVLVPRHGHEPRRGLRRFFLELLLVLVFRHGHEDC